MNRFPGYGKSLCNTDISIAPVKQEEEKDHVYRAASYERKSSKLELTKYISAKVNRILKVNHDA